MILLEFWTKYVELKDLALLNSNANKTKLG